jgi:hypothetical protein
MLDRDRPLITSNRPGMLSLDPSLRFDPCLNDIPRRLRQLTAIFCGRPARPALERLAERDFRPAGSRCPRWHPQSAIGLCRRVGDPDVARDMSRIPSDQLRVSKVTEGQRIRWQSLRYKSRECNQFQSAQETRYSVFLQIAICDNTVSY